MPREKFVASFPGHESRSWLDRKRPRPHRASSARRSSASLPAIQAEQQKLIDIEVNAVAAAAAV